MIKSTNAPLKIAVVIPCYKAGERVIEVIRAISEEVTWIFLVDDACPLKTGDLVEQSVQDSRVQILRHTSNLGVGGATLTGYRAALNVNASIVVKLDADGQMDPRLIKSFCQPIADRRADYVKGNRFFHRTNLRGMPVIRLLGNAGLSFLTKFSTGYWQLFDPTNGYTAIHANVLRALPLEHLANRYFFESDLLYQLGQVRAVVHDLPMHAIYQDEVSSLQPLRMIYPFLRGHTRNFIRRIFYSYFVRGFSLASIELLLGLMALIFGLIFGSYQWCLSSQTQISATAGTVMLAAMPIILGVQLLLSWLHFDVHAEPRIPIGDDLS